MTQCVVIADDLTGGNAAGVLLRKAGRRPFTLMNAGDAARTDMSEFDCVVVPTCSRALAPGAAYDLVFTATSVLRSPGVKLYSKRIDTTLRGNLGSETDAMLDALGDNRVAMVVPCFPSSGRVLVGGYLLVNSVPLHRTEAAKDPKNPVDTPRFADIFARQGKYRIESLHLEDVMGGRDSLAAKIRDFAGCGIRYLIFDAATQEDVDCIADAVLASGVPFAAVDPGVFTAALAQRVLDAPASPIGSRILAAVGSVNPVALRQVEHFLANRSVLNVFMRIGEFLDGERRREDEIERVAGEILASCGGHDVCSIVGEGIIPEHRIALDALARERNCSPDAISELINNAIAEIVRRIVWGEESFKALYTSGGDITVAVCRSLGAGGMRLLDEVRPLAAYGRFVGGGRDGMHVITKGGMVGEADAMSACISYLWSRLSSS
ncbi:MAG: hypothetical protein LUC93_03885 [Planctomycetaceae bacterium]|nr:hypothetical protein [Planctomycetaceae bacterium]